MKYLPYILAVIFLASCSSNYHLRRAKYHERQAIAKGAVIASDTVFIEKVVIRPEVKTDTVFESEEGDTVYISKEKLRIKYVNLPGDNVFIEGKCESDTVKISVPVTITKEISAPKGFWYYFPWLLFVIALAVVAYFIRSVRK